MSVQDLLLGALDELGKGDFRTFKWHLSTNVLDGYNTIPGHYLEDAERTDTVTKLVKSYGNDRAVTITVTVLRKMGHNATAETLEEKYNGTAQSGGGAVVSSTTGSSAAPSSVITASNGGVVIAPNVSDTKGAINITINKR